VQVHGRDLLALARDRSAARARRISENRSLPALQMVSMPKPETIPRLRAGPVAGKVPNCISMSVDGVIVTVP
jgi:hypothetical protein